MSPTRKPNPGGRPTMFQGGKPRTLNLTDDADTLAKAHAAELSRILGRSVTKSQAIEAAIRAYEPTTTPAARS